jgi:hypothetical protein
MAMAQEQIIVTVLVDTALIIALAAVLSAAARRLGQPAVIGQIIAGIILGPSVLGRLPGNLTTALFDPQILPFLDVLAQVGLVLFMFSVGYELDLALLRRAGRGVVAVSVGAFALPMLLGGMLAAGLLAGAADRTIPTGAFVLYLAVALSITAVPVLASIVRDRRMTMTMPGALATASAAVVDVAGWIALAVAVVAVTSQVNSLVLTCVLVAAYVLVAVFLIRPALHRWMRTGALAKHRVPLVVALTMVSAVVTAALGLHTIFGAVLIGVLMPVGPTGPQTRRCCARSSEPASCCCRCSSWVPACRSTSVPCEGATSCCSPLSSSLRWWANSSAQLRGRARRRTWVAGLGDRGRVDEHPWPDRTRRAGCRKGDRSHRRLSLHRPGPDGTDHNHHDGPTAVRPAAR